MTPVNATYENSLPVTCAIITRSSERLRSVRATADGILIPIPTRIRARHTTQSPVRVSIGNRNG